MRPNEVVTAVRRRWWFVILTAVLGCAVMLGLSMRSTPTYQSTASVYFSLPYGNTASDLSQGSTYTQNQMASFAALAVTPAVLDPVITKMQLDTTPAKLDDDVTAAPTAETVILAITVTRTDPQQAADIANAIADQMGVVVRQLSPAGPQGSSSVDVSTVAGAVPAASASAPKTTRNSLAGLLAGALLGIALVSLRQVLDKTVRQAEQVTELTELPVIGVTQKLERSGLTRLDEGTPAAESFRKLRTNLRFIDIAAPAKTIALTSAVAGEGKSTTAANLATTCAAADLSVLVIGADLRRPSVAQLFGLENAIGLTDVLVGDVSLDEALQPWGDRGLSVLASGTVPPNPSELLSSPAMAELMATVAQRFDIVIVDTPPLLPVTDAAVISALVDGVILVVRAGRTTKGQVQAVVANLRAVDSRILGCVLTHARPDRGSGDDAYDAYTAEAPKPQSRHVAMPAGRRSSRT